MGGVGREMAGGNTAVAGDVVAGRYQTVACERLTLKAYAKVNLTLEVLGKRDDGYHNVATILQTVDLADTLEINHADELAVECDEPGLSGDRNLAWKAAEALAERVGISPRAHIRIEKKIPAAAGLGGGSADAAATLVGLNRWWGLGRSREELADVAAGLGSDVPFLLTGGTALGSGRGDEISPLPALPAMDMLLVVPEDRIDAKTPTMYRALKPEDFSDGARTQAISRGLGSGTLTSAGGCNAFERAAREIFPGLARVWDRVAGVTQHPPRLSGAGPAFYCMPSSESERIRVAESLQGTGAAAYLVQTISPAGGDGAQSQIQ
ncbi:MAG: 4-(cytidine 5'-diphospho)-2-C-methyl-D-erythritol kinase [Chloroflexi bacterium]|nr:4-(cytidine 5'-diphospho)-2-C-methyl-D-erythritol kinase [Chloroflexota bacterium]